MLSSEKASTGLSLKEEKITVNFLKKQYESRFHDELRRSEGFHKKISIKQNLEF